VLCLLLAVILSRSAATGPQYDSLGHIRESQSAVVFASVFVIVWCGAAIISFNSRLLGANVSFFQSICVLGYCICPLVIVAVITHLITVISGGSNSLGVRLLQAVLTLLGFSWSSYAAMGFLSEMVGASRKLLALYPILLFYLVIGWIVWTSSSASHAVAPCVGPNCVPLIPGALGTATVHGGFHRGAAVPTSTIAHGAFAHAGTNPTGGDVPQGGIAEAGAQPEDGEAAVGGEEATAEENGTSQDGQDGQDGQEGGLTGEGQSPN